MQAPKGSPERKELKRRIRSLEIALEMELEEDVELSPNALRSPQSTRSRAGTAVSELAWSSDSGSESELEDGYTSALTWERALSACWCAAPPHCGSLVTVSAATRRRGMLWAQELSLLWGYTAMHGAR